MKKLLMLSAATLCAGLLLTGCTAFVTKTKVTTQEVVTLPPVEATQPVETSQPLDQEELFDALAGDSILGVVILNPTQEELELAQNVDQVFPNQEYGEYMLVVPKLPGSTITLQQLTYDYDTGEVTGVEDIHTTSGTEPVSMLVQQDIPEGFPTLRVVVEADGRTGTYDLSYYGKGDGRRDFYILWDREP